MKVHVTHEDKSKLHSEISCEQRKTQPLSTGEAVKIELEPRTENCLHCQKRKKKKRVENGLNPRENWKEMKLKSWYQAVFGLTYPAGSEGGTTHGLLTHTSHRIPLTLASFNWVSDICNGKSANTGILTLLP